MTLDGALQVAGAVTLVGTLLQQEVASSIGYAKEKLPFGGVQNSLLHLPQLDIQHFLKLLALQRVKNHYFVEPVHEFRRELAPRRFHRRALHLLVQTGDRLVRRLHETHPALHEFGNLAAAQVGSQKDHGL